LATGPQQHVNEAVVGAARAEFRLVAGLFPCASNRCRAWRDRTAPARDRRLHCVDVAAGSNRLDPVRTLRRLGDVRLASEWRDLAAELTVRLRQAERLLCGRKICSAAWWLRKDCGSPIRFGRSRVIVI